MNLEQEAADWFALMRGPCADGSREAFDAWYALPGRAEAYDAQLRAWETTMFLTNTRTGQGRRLERAGAWSFAAQPWLIAASLCFMLVMGAALLFGRMETAARFMAASRIEVAALDEPPRRILLPDGSSVVLDRGATLQAAFGGKERRLRLLAGRARFNVAHDALHPFIVEAGGGRVVAHGTMFDVELSASGVNVALLQGAVEVSGDSGRGRRTRIEMVAPRWQFSAGRPAGERGREKEVGYFSGAVVAGVKDFAASGAQGRRASVHHQLLASCSMAAAATILCAPATAQVEERRAVQLPAQKLSASIRELARIFGRNVSADSTVASGRMAGPVSGRYTLDEALFALLRGSGLEAVPSAGGFVIRRAAQGESEQDGIVVTGSRIRGGPVASTTLTYGREQMRSAGGGLKRASPA